MIARTLGVALKDEPSEIKIIVCTALAGLIESLERKQRKKPASGGTAAPAAKIAAVAASAELNAVSEFAPNYLPLLFNLFTSASSSDPIHHPSFVATMAYVGITAPAVSANLFKQLMTRLLAPATVATMRVSLTQLAQAFVPKLKDEELSFLFDSIRPQLSDSDAALQKRSYGVLASICEHHQQWTRTNVALLTETIGSALAACKAQAKKVVSRLSIYLLYECPASQLTDESLGWLSH